MELNTFFANHPKVALAFSGGVDSAYLLYEAVKAGVDVRPYFVKTLFQPEFELRDAWRLGAELGVPVTVLNADVLRLPQVAANPANRCYYCKSAIFTMMCQRAAEDGYSVMMDGTNASDDDGDRPGMRALRELSVRSPLREAGLTKVEIRARSKAAGLFTWDKPAYACLATRIPTDTPITAGLLERVERAENALFAMGYTDFRVRVYHDAARVQLPAGRWPSLAQREVLLTALKSYFEVVLLDMEVR